MAQYKDTCPILRLPLHLRTYIFGLTGLGSKLVSKEQAPWTSIIIEHENLEVFIRRQDWPLESQQGGILWKQFVQEAQSKAFESSLCFVTKQIRLEAACSLLKYNIIVLIAEHKSIDSYERWNPARLMALEEIAIIPCRDDDGVERLVGLLKKKCNFENLRIHLQDGLHYAFMWEDQPQPHGHVESEEWYEDTARSYHVFNGAKDFFIYYASLFHLEIKHEKMVMGEDYDSNQRGKLSPDFRDWEEPWCPSIPQIPMRRY